MNKKGVIFTLFTLLLFVSLTLIALAYVHWYQSIEEEIITDFSRAQNILLASDDIANDILDLNDLRTFSVSRDGPNITYHFGGLINTSKSYSSVFSTYENFLETNYTRDTHIDLNISDLAYGFALPNYTTHTSLQQNALFIYLEDSSNLLQINITLKAYNTTAVSSTSSPSNSANPNTLIRVRVLDSSDVQLLNTAAWLDPSTTNNPFEVRFSSSSPVNVSYGRYGSTNSILSLQYGPNVNVQNVEFVFVDQGHIAQVQFNGTLRVISDDLALYTPLRLQG